MSTQLELETRLRADAEDFDRDFPRSERLEGRILTRAAVTPQATEPRRLTLKQELAFAGLFVVAVAALAVGIARLRAISQPAPVRPAPTVNPLPSTSARLWPFSANDVAAAMIGAGQPTPDTVFITHDGGATWRPVKMPCCFSDSPQIDIRWIDADNLVVMYGSHLIDVTSDGGIHWQVIRSGWAEGTNLPFFLNAREGWEYGGDGLFNTTDGGIHWTRVSSFPSFTGFDSWADRLVFVDPQNGYITPMGSGVLWMTHDGGRSWSRADVSPPRDWPQGYVPQAFIFGKGGLIAFPNGDGGNSATLSVFTTSDGGRTWSGPRSAPGRWLAALDLETWWVVNGQGHLHKSLDGGRTWERIQTSLTLSGGLMPTGNGVLFGFAVNGYVSVPMRGGPPKRLPSLGTVRSTDDGAHWSVVTLPAG